MPTVHAAPLRHLKQEPKKNHIFVIGNLAHSIQTLCGNRSSLAGHAPGLQREQVCFETMEVDVNFTEGGVETAGQGQMCHHKAEESRADCSPVLRNSSTNTLNISKLG